MKSTLSISNNSHIDIDYYSQIFVNTTKYIEKTPEKGWRTVNRSLNTTDVSLHLNGHKTLGTYSKWYTDFCIIDIDDRNIYDVLEIINNFGLVDYHILETSPNSWHVVFKVRYNDKLPTIRLCREHFLYYEKKYKVEIYPKESHGVRLPYSVKHCIFNPKTFSLKSITADAINFFIDEYDSFEAYSIPVEEYVNTQYVFNLNFNFNVHKDWYSECLQLINEGFLPGTRHLSQLKYIYYCWYKNMLLDDAVSHCLDWVKMYKENTKSSIRVIENEIKRQARWIYTNFTKSYRLPEDLHTRKYGYLYTSQVIKLIMVTKGCPYKLNFYIQLFSYLQIRKTRININVHSRILKSYSKNNYIAYLDFLVQKDIIRRSSGYIIGERAKQITAVNWSYDGAEIVRNPETNLYPTNTHDVVRNACSGEQFISILKSCGVERHTIANRFSHFFGGKNKGHI